MKLFAVICMICDHVGLLFFSGNEMVALVLRCIIGRMSFPVFLVLFCDGWTHIRHENYGKHIRDLLFFGILSCPGFWYLVTGKWTPDWSKWNIMFAFLFCALMYLMLDAVGKQKAVLGSDAVLWIRIFIICLVSMIAGSIAVDYGASAPLYAGILYMIREYGKHKQNSVFPALWIRALLCTGLCAVMTWNPWEFMGLAPFLFYDEKKQDSARHKYFFYWFYPLHLVFLGCLHMLLH